MPGAPGWLFLIPAVWTVLVIAASGVYRRSKARPIWYRDDPRPLFLEKRASGSSHRTWSTKLGGAQNALAVALTDEYLVVRPLFPFNLMFLPEI